MLVSGSLFLAGLALLACSSSSSPTDLEGPVPFETIVQRSVPDQGGGQIREVIRDQARWQAVWNDLRARSDLPETPPAVDFGREMVIVVAMPLQGCVAKVTIRAITRQGVGLRVDVLEQPPAPNCVCIVGERPFHAVRLPGTPEPVRFEVEVGRTDC